MQIALALALVLASLALPAVAAADDSQAAQTEATQPAASPADTNPDTGATEGEDDAAAADEETTQHPPVVDLQPPPGDNSTELPAAETTTETKTEAAPAETTPQASVADEASEPTTEAASAETTPQTPQADEASGTTTEAAAGGTTPQPPVADEASDAAPRSSTTEATPQVGEATTSDETAEAAGDTEPEPSSTPEQTTTIDQGASATAVAEQTGGEAGQGNGTGNTFGHGNGAGNANSDVRVDQPGTGEGISQANTADADADATATADVDTAGAATVDQNSDASATAGQSEIGNVQVSVRVDSPGDDGDVTQTNDATAASSAATSDTAGHAAADATAVQDGVSNTVVSVRVFSPGDDGIVRQSNGAGATASADDEAAATAVQDGVRNTYVGIRVESPGERGSLEQSNVADADTTTGSQVSVVSDGINTVVIAEISAPDLRVPDETTVWEWTWHWSGDEADLANGNPFVVSGNTWAWSWGDASQGTVVERQATTADVAGTWTWDWNWERELPGWAWEWRQEATLACATCVWVWRWDWRWTGQPPMSSPAPHTDPPAGAREQSTSVTAVAHAHADALVTQVVDQDNEGGVQFAGQIADVEQVADASALARQRLAGARLGVVLVDDQGRTLVVVATAATATWIDQSGVQVGGVAGEGQLDQWSGQQVTVLQGAIADARGEQELSAGADGHGAVLADALAVSGNEQSGVQAGFLGDGLLDKWLGQQIIVAQVAGAAARTTQALDEITGATATAKSISRNLSLVGQAAVQDAARGAGIGSQTVAQAIVIVQDALALASTSQPSDTSARLATSDAAAINRSLILQAAAQSMDGASFLDLQDIIQEAALTQEAFAVSTSNGGIGGPARTVNCSTIQQGAGQGIGSYVSVDTVDLTSFCVPPSAATGESVPQAPAHPWSLGSSDSGVDVVMTLEDEILVGHGTTRYRGTPGSVFSPVLTPPAFRTSIGSARNTGEAGETGSRAAALSQVSSPVPSQAGFDSRPKGSPGTDTVAGKSPLPWTGGPPQWATAFADAVAAFGGSGIAAILAFLALTPPLLRRVRDGAVVGRPISVSAPIDVPI